MLLFYNMLAPSFHSLFFTGLILLSILIIFIMNFNKFIKLDYYKKITILSLISVAIGIHGLIHLGVEMKYDFNPYRWFF